MQVFISPVSSAVASASARCSPKLRALLALLLLSPLPSALCPRASAQSIPLSPTAQASGAQITHSQGIEFVTIGSAGNAPWPGNGTEGDRAVGRGSVGNEYRIGRFEVTTAQWVEFFNAAYDRPSSDRLPHLFPPSFWGGISTAPHTPGGLRWTTTTQSANLPVGDISWRMAAMYANWLCNDKSAARAAFLNGAYDVSTFGYSGTTFTDQLTHNAGARFWIPTWDESLKASHYDPNRHGPGQGDWWLYNTTSDLAPIYGPPGLSFNGQPTQANSGWDSVNFPGFNPFGVRLGAYPTVQSPWGLLDTAGGTSEWNEFVVLVAGRFPIGRFFDGSSWDTFGNQPADRIHFSGGDFPSLSTYDLGFRIAAAAVPSPGSVVPFLILASVLNARRRNRGAQTCARDWQSVSV